MKDEIYHRAIGIQYTKNNIEKKFYIFSFTRVGDLSEFVLFNKTVYSRVGDLSEFVLFNKTVYSRVVDDIALFGYLIKKDK